MTQPAKHLHLPIITASRLRAWRRCQRLEQLRYQLGYEPVAKAHALRFGTLIHAGLEAWFRALLAGMYGDDVIDHALEMMGQGDVDPFDRVKAEALLTGYHLRWIDEPLDVIDVEAEFRAPLINPATGAESRTFQIGGKIDALVRHRFDGRIFYVEHKTSSLDITAGSDYWKQLRLDGQVSIYDVGARALGHDVSGCIYDVIRKPQLELRRATPIDDRKYTKEKRDKAGNITEPSRLYSGQRETDETLEEYQRRLVGDIASDPSKYFSRAEVVRLEGERERFARRLWREGQLLRMAQTDDVAPENPDGCFLPGRPCPYWGACTGEASLDDPALFTRSDNFHSELTPPEATKEQS